VNTLTGYIERERGGPLIYSVMVNHRVAGYAEALAQIDSVVVELGR
jgi:D-alanyl-D-alanine carboxypeptidase